MKIFPFSRGNSPELQRQRALDEHLVVSGRSIDVLHQALREALDVVGEMHEVGAENGLAMQKVTDWLEVERPPIAKLNFNLADDNVLVDGKGALSRNAVEANLLKAIRSATDARMTTNPVARSAMIQEAAKDVEAAADLCRRGYVDRQPSQPYPALAVHAMDFQIQMAAGCSRRDAVQAEEKIRDLYAEGLGISIDRDLKELIEGLDHTLKAMPGLVDRAVNACNTAGLPINEPASRREIEEDDSDFDPDPMI